MQEGMLTFYILENKAPNGSMPVEKLVPVCQAYYSERAVGVTRLYAAMGANQRIDSLLRIYNFWDLPKVGRKRVEYVIPEDGDQYRITAVQKVVDEDAVDLTLERLEELYDVDTE